MARSAAFSFTGIRRNLNRKISPYFVRNSSATDIDINGLYSIVGRGTPAYYGDKGLILESAATNLILRSSEFDNASWIAVQSVVVANAATAPDGTATADFIRADATASATHRIYQSVTTSAGVNTVSVFAKAGAVSWLGMRTTSGTVSFFNISSGALGTKAAAHSSISITPAAYGFYRCAVTWTDAGGATAVGFDLCEADGDNAWNGDSSSGLYLWGAQLETQSFATSYIPTTTTTVTRATANIMGIPLSAMGIASQTNEYSFCDVVIPYHSSSLVHPANAVLFSVSNAALTEWFRIFFDSSSGTAGRLTFFKRHGAAVDTYLGSTPVPSYNAREPLLIACSVGATNGMLLRVGPSVFTMGTANAKADFSAPLNNLSISGSPVNSSLIRQGFQIWDRALSRAELENLTAERIKKASVGYKRRR